MKTSKTKIILIIMVGFLLLLFGGCTLLVIGAALVEPTEPTETIAKPKSTEIIHEKVKETVKQIETTTSAPIKTIKPTLKPIKTNKSTEKPKKLSYDASITYNQLAREPSKYEFKGVVFTGKIIQVMEGNTVTNYRIAIGSNYSKIMYCVKNNKNDEPRLLENDIIRFKGLSCGLLTYETVLGAKISVPSVVIHEIINK